MRWWAKLLISGRTGPRRAALALEPLEDRLAPAVVTVDPGAYTGAWWLAGEPGHRGIANVDVPLGSTDVQLWAESTLVTRFNTDASGNVSVQNTAATVASGNAITIQTAAITVNPNGYTGSWWVAGDDGHRGTDTVNVIRGVTGAQLWAESALVTLFDTDASGSVAVSNAVSSSSTGSTVTFNTSVLTVDPGAYTGSWWVAGDDGHRGVDEVTVIRGVADAQLWAESALVTPFTTDASGNVSVSNAASSTASGSAVTFRTFAMNVIGNYSGIWWVAGDEQHLGPGPVNVVAGVTGAQLWLSPSLYFAFDTDADGNVTSRNASLATGGFRTLEFNTVTINIDPGDYTGFYRSDVSQSFSDSFGYQSFGVFPSTTNHTIDFAGGTSPITFDVDASGTIINQNPEAATATGNTLQFITRTVQFDPAGFHDQYSALISNRYTFVSGPLSLVVPVNTLFGFDIEGSGTGALVQPDGTIVLENPDAAELVGGVIRLKTTVVHIDPGAYTGAYRLGEVRPLSFGPADFVLVPATGSYSVTIGDEYAGFDLDAFGVPYNEPELHFTVNGEPVTLVVSAGASVSTDSDGVSDNVEARAPNAGDGNNDGSQDAEQDNVASLPTSVDGSYVTVVAPAGTQLVNVTVRAALPSDLPEAVAFPEGVVEFELRGLAPGAAAAVTLLFADAQVPSTYYKFGPTTADPTPHWYEFLFDGTTGAAILGDRVVLHFVDGRRGDNDMVANGTVLDPGAPSVATSNISFDPGAYTGTYQLAGRPAARGPTSVDFAPGTYTVALPNDTITFDVDPFGKVTSRNGAAATGGYGSLRLNATTVAVDQGDYTGAIALDGVPGASGVSGQTFTVVPGVRNYALTFGGATGLTFDVGDDGSVTSRYYSAAHGDGPTLRLHTTTVTVERNGYSGALGVRNYDTGSTSGDARFVLVTGLRGYALTFGDEARLTFDLDPTGHTVSGDPEAATATLATLHLNTVPVRVNPGEFAGAYSLGPTAPQGTEYQLVRNVDNFAVHFDTGARALFGVNADGTVTSHDLALLGASGNTLTLRVPAPTAAPAPAAVVHRPAELMVVGGGGAVTAFNPATGTRTFSTVAFPGFSGGVAVATGDVNGDGTEDVIAAAGANGHVKVFDGRTGTELLSFFAFPGFGGTVSVATGDIDGDGAADVVVGAGSGGHVKAFRGHDGALLRSFFAFDGYAGGVNVASGDVDGDNRAELFVVTTSGASHVKAFSGRDGSLLRSFFAFDNADAPSGLASLAAGDLDGDGLAEIIVGSGVAPVVRVFAGATGQRRAEVNVFRGFAGGVRVGTTDRDGDGLADIVAAAGPGSGGGHVKVFRGTDLTELDSFFALSSNAVGGAFVG